MSAVLAYGRWVVGGSWARETPSASRLTRGRLAASWSIVIVLVAAALTSLAAGGFLSGVAVALLWPFAQAAVVVGLAYAARSLRRTI